MSDLLPIPPARRFRKSDEGQALVLTALGMVVFMLMAGLGVDVGYLHYKKQQMQKAADAGALAAATALINYGGINGQLQIINAGKADAQANGFTDGQNGITVAVNHPPGTNGDPFQGKFNYVEVIVAQPQPTFFMRVLGYNSVNVSSRAVATAVGSGSGCLYSLAPSGIDTFDVGFGAQVSSNCGILVASSSSSAFEAKAGSRVTAPSIGIVGGDSGSGTLDPAPTTGIAPFTDPLANVPAPTVPSNCQANGYNNGRRDAHLSPGSGAFCNGITLSGGDGVHVTLDPGTYVLMGGGLQVTGSPTITGNGVTFYNTGNTTVNGTYYPYVPVTLTGSGDTHLSAPENGSLAGILIFQDRHITNDQRPNSVDGSRGQIYTGALYFPTTALQYRGSQIVNPYELLIAWKLQLLGHTTLANHYNDLQNGGSPIHNATLVE
jgi:Flp pilus assembly protein TadG